MLPLIVALLVGGMTPDSASCASLTSRSRPHATVTAAQAVPSGAFTPPDGAPLPSLPAFCRVSMTLTPSSDSDIKVEIWLPTAGWNGKFQAVGNGGFGGSINYGDLAAGIAHGYATASTDTGHADHTGAFAFGHPEKVVDYAWRSEHEMTVAAKTIIEAFYGSAPRLSYWNGCSAGGKQALKEAQRFPADFDGIVAGSPALDWTGRAIQSLWVAQALHRDEASYIPPAKYPAMHKAVVDQCDALDGVRDGVLEDPTRCAFDPAVLTCKGPDAVTCLTPPQVEAARKVYAGPVNPRTHEQIFPGLEPGSEFNWQNLGGPEPLVAGFDHLRYIVFKNPAWDYHTLNFDSDVARVRAADNGTIDAKDPNLAPFFNRGGKLIQYHGWSDQQIASLSSVHYYDDVLRTLGGATRTYASYRLFMVPGMGHCRGGDGPNTFDMLGALERWVEQGQAPDAVVASKIEKGVVVRTRPLCPYPQVAVYTGTGSTDEAASFACRVPPQPGPSAPAR